MANKGSRFGQTSPNQPNARPVEVSQTQENIAERMYRRASRQCARQSSQVIEMLPELYTQGDLALSRQEDGRLPWITTRVDPYEHAANCDHCGGEILEVPGILRHDRLARFKRITVIETFFAGLRVEYLRDLNAEYPNLDDEIVDMEAGQEASNSRSWSGNIIDQATGDPLLSEAVGRFIIAKDPGIPGGTRKRVIDNHLRLIKRFGGVRVDPIPGRHFHELERIVTQGIRRGSRPEKVAELIKNLDGVTKRRAEVIARDQTVKYNGTMTQIRHRQVGVTTYFWRAGSDQRVRKLHRQRDNIEFAYNNPPRMNSTDGHPGRPVQCRCWANPNLRRAAGLDTVPLGHPPGITLAKDLDEAA